eukprot:gene43708-34673_t
MEHRGAAKGWPPPGGGARVGGCAVGGQVGGSVAGPASGGDLVDQAPECRQLPNLRVELRIMIDDMHTCSR